CLLGKGEGSARNYCLWVEAGTRIVMFQQHNDVWFQVKSKRGVTDGAWTHVAATVEGSKATLYINGQKDGELIRAKPASTPASPLGIGWACYHVAFRGVLDDVRVYRRALSADEVQGLVEQAR
ncbi:MAG TPA: LamG domain-containing protein, partial [Planctomycetota bacterium]|nr:LamG domain-containing protein [Planctomycetota bacterium]